jgi:hypothetical protein
MRVVDAGQKPAGRMGPMTAAAVAALCCCTLACMPALVVAYLSLERGYELASDTRFDILTKLSGIRISDVPRERAFFCASVASASVLRERPAPAGMLFLVLSAIGGDPEHRRAVARPRAQILVQDKHPAR